MPTRALLLGLCSVAAFGGAALDNRIDAAVGGGAGPTHVRTVAELLAEWGALEPQLEPQPQQGLQGSPIAPDAELLTAALGIARELTGAAAQLGAKGHGAQARQLKKYVSAIQVRCEAPSSRRSSALLPPPAAVREEDEEQTTSAKASSPSASQPPVAGAPLPGVPPCLATPMCW
jgi:hypothetical protein